MLSREKKIGIPLFMQDGHFIQESVITTLYCKTCKGKPFARGNSPRCAAPHDLTSRLEVYRGPEGHQISALELRTETHDDYFEPNFFAGDFLFGSYSTS
jgi:hypothetical protein